MPILLFTSIHVRYLCESWTIKKAKCQRTDASEVWCWRILLRVPWTARRSNRSMLKEISPEYSLEGLMLKLKLQYFGHLIRRTDSFEKTLMLGQIEGRRRRGRQRMRWLDESPTQWTWVWVNSGSWWWTGRSGMLQSMGSQRVRHDWATELNWDWDGIYCEVLLWGLAKLQFPVLDDGYKSGWFIILLNIWVYSNCISK